MGDVLGGIVESFCWFKCRFAACDNKYLTTQIYLNLQCFFGYGRGNKNKLDDKFFDITGLKPTWDLI
jgi:hypothetical protein